MSKKTAPKRGRPPKDLAGDVRELAHDLMPLAANVALGELTVVNIPLQMQTQPGEFRVTFHPDKTVAGLYFLKAGTPVS